MLRDRVLLVHAFHPFFLEKDTSWFDQEAGSLHEARSHNTWMQTHTMEVSVGQRLLVSAFIQSCIDLGYTKSDDVYSPGEFSLTGGTIRIGMRQDALYQIILAGNTVEDIRQIPYPASLQAKTIPQELDTLVPGDYVTHIDHGIGVFRGYAMRTSDFDFAPFSRDHESENPMPEQGYFVIEYAPARQGAEPDKLFVPFEQLKKISPYYGFTKPTIHRLGSELWIKTKRKAKEDIIAYAKELLALYAARSGSTRPAYRRTQDAYAALSESFGFEETPDQERALADVDHDLDQDIPMDRIIVGDVGFGKTEIALRAACRVALNGRQVALLAPTTILAYQHFQTFQKRCAAFPIKVGFLSRLAGEKENKAVLKEVAQGTVDIVIATHRLLSKDITFKNLGMLVIDEEQRFGVTHKEKIKKLKHDVDILSLSATPIPRTFSMALSRLKSLSAIRTPPQERLAIKTFVMPFSWHTVKDAIDPELARNGQAYVLYNRIATIEKIHAQITKLFPKVSIGVIHGKMPEHDLVDTMNKFRQKKIQVLIATTIIENGLDISNANTIIIADASRLGLGQAHQLRGRIGRGTVQSWAYFLYNPKSLTEQAKQRLTVLRRLQYLGAGYEIAQHDLEIRGAGNLLGKDQSGTVNAIGINLYLHMLSQEMERLQTS